MTLVGLGNRVTEASDSILFSCKSSTQINENQPRPLFLPIWTPDGQNLTFSSARGGQSNLFLKAADGTGIAEQLLTSLQHQDPGSWDPDGKILEPP
jgi:Tol biopolymer transport system component